MQREEVPRTKRVQKSLPRRRGRLPADWVEARVYMTKGHYDQLLEFARAKGVKFSTYARRTLITAPHGAILNGENPDGWENCP